jgi:hypothetical protein
MLTRLWSYLRGLFRRPGRSEPAKPGEPEAAAPIAPSLSEEPAIASLHDPCEDEDEDEWADEEVEALGDEPDPFITEAPADPGLALIDTQALRAQSRAAALNGEHRIYLSSPAGPGTLAEALNVLLEEGLVEAHFVETEGEAPHLLYRPVSGGRGRA